MALPRKPIFCFIIVTKTCFFKCNICKMWSMPKNPEELNVQQIKSFVENLSGFLDERILIHLIGGEPFYKEGIMELISFITGKGFTVSLTTNGYLIDESKAKEIADSGLNSVFLSLDSLNEKTHEFLRGTKDCYRKIMNAIEYLNRYSPQTHIGVTCTINGTNIRDVLELTEWVNRNGKLDYIYFNAMLQPFNDEDMELEWFKKEKYKFLWPQDSMLTDAVFDELKRMKLAGYKIDNPLSQFDVFKSYFKDPLKFIRAPISRKGRCPRGDASLEVNSEGDMYLCFKMEPIGNVKRDRLEDVWYSEKAEKIRKQIYDCTLECDAVINTPYETVDRTIEQIEHEKDF